MDIQKRREEKQEKYTYLMIVASCILLVLQLYAIPRDNTRLMSLSNQGLILLWLGLGSLRILRRIAGRCPAYLLSAVWMLFFVLAAFLFAAVKNSASVKSNLTPLINFLVLPVMLLYCTVYSVPEKTKKALLITGIITSFVYIQLYHSDLRHIFTSYYGDSNLPEVTLGYPNPNQTAMYLFVCAVNLLASIFYFRKKLVRFLLTVDFIYICFILHKTMSRTARILLIALLALMLFVRKRKLPKRSVTIVLLIPVAYACLALFLSTFFGGVTLWGESILNGRESILGRYLNNIDLLSFLLGNFTRFHFDNMHNGYVSIAATAGIFAIVFYVTFLKRCLDYNFRTAFLQKHSAVGFIGFLCIIAYSSSEAAFFVGGSTYAFLVLTVYLLFARPYTTNQPQNSEESTQ